MKKLVILCAAAIFAFTGCAETGPQTKTGKGTLYGTLGGAAAGALLGQAIGGNTKATALGTAVGAGVGALAGAGIGHAMDEQEKQFNDALASSEAASVRREGNLIAIVMKGDVTFDTGSSVIKPGLYTEIKRIADIMVQYPQTTIRVEGHTDSQGTLANNQRLSEKRAQSVANLLIQEGVSPSRITTIGYGESQPVASNNNASGRQMNRRVEIKVDGGQQS